MYGPNGDCHCPFHQGDWVNTKVWACQVCGDSTGCDCTVQGWRSGQRVKAWSFLCASQRARLRRKK